MKRTPLRRKTPLKANRKNSDFETLPLCQAHHQQGNHGVALHAGVETWEGNYGTQEDLLAATRLLLAFTFPEWNEINGERILDTPA